MARGQAAGYASRLESLPAGGANAILFSTFRGRLAAASLSTLLVASCFTHQVRAGQRGYVVQPNDTLSGIAARFGTTVPALMARTISVNQASLSPGKRY